MDEVISDTERNTCTTSCITADNSIYDVSYIKSYTQMKE
jgi:hypothetical protein